MWESLQIKYNDEVYHFQIIRFNQLPGKFEFQILLQGVTMTICKSPLMDWELKNESKVISNDLVKFIGKTIADKYRLSFDQPDYSMAQPKQTFPPVG